MYVCIYHCYSVTKSCPALCNPMDCSTPGFPVLYHLPEFLQTHVHRVGDAIQPSHPLLLPSPPFPASGSLPLSQPFKSGGQSIGASTSVLPMNIQCWFPLRLTDLISLLSKDSQKSSLAPQFNFILSFLCSPALISLHDYWKNHSFDCMDLCQQSDVSQL